VFFNPQVEGNSDFSINWEGCETYPSVESAEAAIEQIIKGEVGTQFGKDYRAGKYHKGVPQPYALEVKTIYVPE
jgi:hypothetical protein